MSEHQNLEHLVKAAQHAGLPTGEVELPKSRQLIANGIRLHYLEWGEPGAVPLVLLHGGSLNAHTWDLVCVVLSRTYRCLALDLRGHGDSEWAAGLDYGFETMSRDVEDLIGTLGLDEPTVIGMSYGALVALNIAGARRTKLGGLVIIDAGPVLHTDAAKEIVEFTRGDYEMDSIDDFVERAMAIRPARREDLVRGNVLHNLRQLPNGRWAWKWDWRRHENYDLERMRNEQSQLWGQVVKIDTPTLIARGENSRVFLKEDGEQLASSIPGAKLVTVEGAGHNIQGSNPAGLLSHLLPFLEESGKRGQQGR
ncbi:MAG: alpha/beta fold hydrolase [Acidimicrobiales bacterium]